MFDVLSRMIRTGILTESSPTPLEEIPVFESVKGPIRRWIDHDLHDSRDAPFRS